MTEMNYQNWKIRGATSERYTFTRRHGQKEGTNGGGASCN